MSWERTIWAEDDFEHKWLGEDMARVRRAVEEQDAIDTLNGPDERLDDIGQRIFFLAVRRDMPRAQAAKFAMDGNLRQRRRVVEDLESRIDAEMQRRYPNMYQRPNEFSTLDQRLKFWIERIERPGFVYFVQRGDDGPVKIGYTNDPEKRRRTLQTGNAEELVLREVLPGDRQLEANMHRRFNEARIRGEWFDADYLPLILPYAEGLAEQAFLAYQGGGIAPVSDGINTRSGQNLQQLRSDIERMWRNGHGVAEIAALLRITELDLQSQIREMRKTTLYDLSVHGWKNTRGTKHESLREKDSA